jgi:prolyl oligopeptidase
MVAISTVAPVRPQVAGSSAAARTEAPLERADISNSASAVCRNFKFGGIPGGADIANPASEVCRNFKFGMLGLPKFQIQRATGVAGPRAAASAGVAVSHAVGSALARSPLPPYPATPSETVVTDYHGTPVSDPYRWLENTNDMATVDWVGQQNAYTAQYLATLPGKPQVVSRLNQILGAGSIGAPFPVSDKLFYFRRTGMQNQSVMYMQTADGQEKQVVDPNTWAADGTEAMDWDFPSPDGRYVAYGRSSGGTEHSTMYIVDTQTGAELPDVIPDTRSASVAWLPDASGFYYTRYPAAGTVPPGQENYHRHVFFHQLGTDPAKDPQIFGDGLGQTDWPDVSLSKDGRHLLVTVEKDGTNQDCFVLDRTNNQWITIAQGKKATYSGEVIDGQAYLMTSDGAERNRIIKVDLQHPDPGYWKEIVPQQPGTLTSFDIVGGKLVTHQLVNASSKLSVYDLDGNPQGDLPLPGLGTVDALNGSDDDNNLYYRFSSYNHPPVVLQWNAATGQTGTWKEMQIPGFDPSAYDLHQEWFTSKDGTRVPMFVVHQKGIALDGSHPTFLTGYGGFDISMTPVFSSNLVPWLENGGVVAMPNLRGGGEFGEAWHQDGMLDKKQHVFDDFEGAGQWLIDQGYTSASKLGVSGGSNGGLLIGAVVTQRPDLFGAAVSHVPLLDMLRYDHFGIAKLWIPEYGTASDAKQFPTLAAYSPYHNVKDGTPYPATMFMSAADDGRVDPLHARKMTARMQAATTSGQPVLLREEAGAGHGQGKPLGKVIEEKADELIFMGQHLGLQFA